ncbi:SIS domain-containing protein [Collinsella sp. zg1085]|uniref:SIS domain-containing protein n=1 Tax=Collinsella sp. zg1085 TaxID=2844380 RepID=UPI001C0AC337|nr:SIS domain-containing protein [Collinsella sp. zg1085]QWT17813.1 SIS domain-containing protein [Collinsella sp. zg1085]
MYEIDLACPQQIVAHLLKAHEIKQVAFVGCGASMSELYPAFYFLKNNTQQLNVQIFTANEFNYDKPAWLGTHTLVVSCSLGGGTPETVEANKCAKAAGASVIAITHIPDSALTEGVDAVIVHGFEANYAAKTEKMGYALALALELLYQIEGTELYEDMCAGLTGVFEVAENAALSSGKDAALWAHAHKDDDCIHFMASGASEKVAYSTSLFLMMEMQWINSGNFNSGEYFHGPFELTDDKHSFVLFMSDGKTRPMDARALAFLQRFDAQYLLIDAKDFGLTNVVPASVATYISPLVHTAVMRVYAEQLAEARQHPLTKRRYMWKLTY